MEVRDYEHKLKMEISENESRKELTHSERVAYAREIERIEKEKAMKRMTSGVNQYSPSSPGVQGGTHGKTCDIVARAVGYGSGTTYERAKFVVNNASPETVAKLDAGEISVKKAFQETERQKKSRPENIVGPAVGYGSGRTYQEARFVVENGSPELVAQMDAGEISVHAAYHETKQQKQIPAPVHAKGAKPVVAKLKSSAEADDSARELKALLVDFQAYLEEFERRFSNLVSRIPDLNATGIDFNSSLRAYRNVLVLVDGAVKLKKFVEKKVGA